MPCTKLIIVLFSDYERCVENAVHCQSILFDDWSKKTLKKQLQARELLERTK